MPLGKSPILQNDLMAEGDNQKYLLFNDALVNLEDAANRALTIDLSADNVALTETQTTRFAVVQCEGHSVARTLTIPISVGSPPVTTNRVLAVRNSGTGAVTVTHNNSGTDIVIPVAETALLYCNGTDIISLGGVANAATMPLSDDGTQVIAALLSLNIAGNGYTITDDGNGAATITFNIPTDFTGMDDTPADYTGHANKVLAVNATEDGVEFITNPGMTDAAVKTAYENNADTNAFTDAEKTKLAGVEPNATADMTGAQIKSAYEGEANTNAFTDAEKAKLAGLEEGKFKGSYLNESALNSAHPTADVGSYAFVDAGIGTDALLYIWDDDDSDWVVSSSGGGTDTPADIKTKYESNADTNAFTDAEKAKLSGIDAGATDDQTGAEIVSAIDTELGSTDWQSGGGGGSSLPTINSGDSGKALVVNGTEDGTEWKDVGDRAYIAATNAFIAAEPGAASSSAYATKGNVIKALSDRILHRVSSVFTAGQTVKLVVAEVGSAQPHTITEIIYESVPETISSSTGHTFTVGAIPLTSGTTYAIMFVRTDGSATTAMAVPFPPYAGVVDPFGDLEWESSVRYASNSPAVSDNTYHDTLTGVYMIVDTADPVLSEGWAANHPTLQNSTGTSYTVTNADLTGTNILKLNNASANTVDVPAGLIGTSPLTIVQVGAGQTTIVAGSGVTINSLEGNLALAGQYASASLIPDGTDNYILIGALA
ncbi:hypothetical protein MAL1_00083 [Bacteriophage DSS3_MAL1]|nr:hypothetical protein MAL1_00083 [Bacteriophage DSS3_MAL1]